MLDHLGELPQYAAKKFGDKQALCYENYSFSFNEISALVEKLATNLSSLGIKEGNVVTLYASNCWEWIISYVGIARVGAVINPVNTMLTPLEVEYVIDDCKAKAIITSSDKEETYGIIITPITKPAAKALSEDTSRPNLSPNSLKKGPTVNAAKNP